MRTTGWLRCLNNKQATFAKHAASNATFTNADLTIIATTLGRFLGFHVPGHRQLQPWEVSPKFLLELVPFTWLPDVATSELHLFPHGDQAELQSSVRKPAPLRRAVRLPWPEAGLQAPAQSVQALTVTLYSY